MGKDENGKVMHRSYVSIAAEDINSISDSELFGELARKFSFSLEQTQAIAWEYQIKHLRELAAALNSAHFFMEFLIPRMGRRADLVVLHAGKIFVIEYKIGAKIFDRSSLDQVYGYGLDLKQFHAASHEIPVVPILVATQATDEGDQDVTWDSDQLAKPLRSNPDFLAQKIISIGGLFLSPSIDPQKWLAGLYRPTPTIVEAAQALYRGHKVEEISRSEAGAENLTATVDYVSGVIEEAKQHGRKIICFITGVPGSGKTLAGLTLATARQRMHADDHAVFLSGNGPLVDVLREALTLDAISQAKSNGTSVSRVHEERKASAFIQNIHHFRDDALASISAPIEKVAIFDEAQRAWNVEQTSKFMQQKRGQHGFSMSEPEFLLSVMDRHDDWCVIVCLVGDGQEINTGEAGIDEWVQALERSFTHWHAYIPPKINLQPKLAHVLTSHNLHLATSLRSFRAEYLSDFVNCVIDGDDKAALKIASKLVDYPIYVTRDLIAARSWLENSKRGRERIGLLASSNALRLKPDGIYVKANVDPINWFLAPSEDVRASDALEDVATEFDVQGLELDWACACWDANYRRNANTWEHFQFKGTRWLKVSKEARKEHIANSYRVLLTRARQGLIVFVPKGECGDLTRDPVAYDMIYQFLLSCGFRQLQS